MHITRDSAGRLHTASYPNGITETDGYDADGNWLTISSTGGVLGITLVTNTYDPADDLTTSASSISGRQPLTTTYTYDGNGNQIIASGPSYATVSTYNQQNQLIQVQGPTTDLQLVYDGQGDRLRSYEQQASGTPVIVNDVQDLVGAPGNWVNTGAQPLPDGLSDLASDGTQDYLYLQPGSDMAPYNPTTTHATYLAIDTLGSVRLATDPTNAVIGEGAYDA